MRRPWRLKRSMRRRGDERQSSWKVIQCIWYVVCHRMPSYAVIYYSSLSIATKRRVPTWLEPCLSSLWLPTLLEKLLTRAKSILLSLSYVFYIFWVESVLQTQQTSNVTSCRLDAQVVHQVMLRMVVCWCSRSACRRLTVWQFHPNSTTRTTATTGSCWYFVPGYRYAVSVVVFPSVCDRHYKYLCRRMYHAILSYCTVSLHSHSHSR